MAYAPCKLKSGMGGSHNGRSRWESTEILKNDSKSRRRALDKHVIKDELKEVLSDCKGTTS